MIEENKEPIHIECTGATRNGAFEGDGLLQVVVHPIPVEMLRGLGNHIGMEVYKWLKEQGMELEVPVEIQPAGKTVQ
jgi:hypothetical protein